MKTLYIDCAMGAAGDMLGAALLELIPNPEMFINKANALGIPGVSFFADTSLKCGISGTHITVKVNGKEEGHIFPDSFEDNSKHEFCPKQAHIHSCGDTNEDNNILEDCHTHHHHSGLEDIKNIVSELKVSDKVKSDVNAIYNLIAEAESNVHNVDIEHIHFHEVGTMDAIADITLVCMLMEEIAAEQIIVSPIHVGSGHVKCAHGLLPVPAPATAYILRNVPVYSENIKGELCTPTGAALLKYFATSFGDMPIMRISNIGYGMGKKDFAAANCVRILLGKTADTKDTVTELSCNVDDMTPEAIGFAMNCLFDSGALEVYTVAVGMKKNRPGTLLCVMCKNENKDDMITLMFKHTTTIGIRENISNRYVLNRRTQIIQSQYGFIRKKISSGYGITREKLEYDDVASVAKANNMSMADVIRAIESKANKAEELDD